MNVDAQIAQRVIDRFTLHGLPVLCIHDSFIVPYTHVRALKGFMRWASEAVVGVPLAVEANGPGLDEMADAPDYVQQDFIRWRQTPRCHGYLERMEEHQKKWGENLAAS